MQFVDEAKITVKAGNGGKGCISFRREKYVPKGGPDGGNGGNGGNVILRADRQLGTLLDFKYQRHYRAEAGEHGRGKRQDGKWGKDIIIRVPCGTIVKDAGDGRVLADLIEDQDELTVARGGKGGKGNAEFATPTNQAPRIAEPGTAGEERDFLLELKLLADVGLVGLPNAGKSTLISVISAARPKIADYPFTTLVPNLGIVRYGEGKSFTVADIPGLIEGAHRGKGLGMQFLRHVERTRVLVFLVESPSEDPRADFDVLMNELREYDPELALKPKLVALTKTDLLDRRALKRVQAVSFGRGVTVHAISAVAGTGVKTLTDAVWTLLHKKPRKTHKALLEEET